MELETPGAQLRHEGPDGFTGVPAFGAGIPVVAVVDHEDIPR